jgi:Rap1a immunity proteins
MKKIATLVMAATLLGSAPMHAANRPYVDGNHWYSACLTDNSISQAWCNAYVGGVGDGIRMWARVSPATRPFCAPEGVTNYQLRDIGLAYIAAHTKDRHLEAVTLLIAAFKETWPCER